MLSFQCAFTMLDVLGFKNKLNSPDRARIFGDFIDITKDMYRTFDSKPSGDVLDLLRSGDEKVLLYSDTLIYFKAISSTTLPCDALVSAATFATRVISGCLEKQLLTRGTIAVGEIFYNKEPEVIAGPVVNEAAQHYEIGDWIGCHLAPSAVTVLDSVPDDRKPRTLSRFTEYSMPVVTKSGEVVRSRQWGLRWLEYQCEHMAEYSQYLYDGDLKSTIIAAKAAGTTEADATLQYYLNLLKKYSVGNPQAKAKVENTIGLYE